MKSLKSLNERPEHTPPPLSSKGKETEELHGGCCVSPCSDSSSRVTLSVAYKAIAVADAVISGMHVMDSLEKTVTELLGALVLTGKIRESEYLPNESDRTSEMRATLSDLRERFVSCYPDTEWKSGIGLVRQDTTGNLHGQG